MVWDDWEIDSHAGCCTAVIQQENGEHSLRSKLTKSSTSSTIIVHGSARTTQYFRTVYLSWYCLYKYSIFDATDTTINRAYVPMKQVQAFLTELYHGEPKACDLARFLDKIKTVEDSHVSFDEVRSAMAELKKEVRWKLYYYTSSSIINRNHTPRFQWRL